MPDIVEQPIRPATAGEVFGRCRLSEPAELLLRGDQTPQSYFAELVQAKLHEDAIRFAAEYLTPREAVWWGVLCLWQVFRQQVPPQEAALLKRVVEWVQQPQEEHRRALESGIRSADNRLLGKNLALAAFYSGGSISLVDQPAVDPPPGQTASSVAAAVLMASRQVPPALHEACLLHFLKLAGEVSRGESSWSEPSDGPSPSQKELQHAR